MQFTWDPRKAALNVQKHGVEFADAATIFDGFVVTDEDTSEAYGEQRFISLGMMRGAMVLVVVHLIEPDRLHLISAREAEPHEARYYWREFARQYGG